MGLKGSLMRLRLRWPSVRDGEEEGEGTGGPWLRRCLLSTLDSLVA